MHGPRKLVTYQRIGAARAADLPPRVQESLRLHLAYILDQTARRWQGRAWLGPRAPLQVRPGDGRSVLYVQTQALYICRRKLNALASAPIRSEHRDG